VREELEGNGPEDIWTLEKEVEICNSKINEMAGVINTQLDNIEIIEKEIQLEEKIDEIQKS
jgi:hypothetical protein